MKPTVGRIVHFLPLVGAEVRPAIIVSVSANSPEQRVNLQQFTDGSNDDPGRLNPELIVWRTSVPFSDEPKAGHWSWPPRVPS